MVGVPGRSKGCHTCKQRRIKCNEERPQCSNCVKSKRTCGGYVPKRAFILSENMLACQPAAPQFTSDCTQSEPLMVARWRVDPEKPSQRILKLGINSLYRHRFHGSDPLPAKISSRHAGRQQILDIFLTSHLPSEDIRSDKRPLIKQRNWLLQVQDAAALTPALETSILAVCIARLGRKHDNESVVREGLTMYTRALCHLRHALQNPQVLHLDETIAACMALIMFESAQCPAQSIESCIAHYQGAMNLLLLRSPEAYEAGLAHCMLQELRIQSVFQGMRSRSKTPLADPRWRDLPWKTSHKGLRDLLIDILLEMPEIYHLMDKLARETCPSRVLCGLTCIVELCWRIDSQLYDWYNHLETSVAGPVYWPKLSTTDSPVDDAESGKVFAVAFHFASYDVAHALILYWVALLLVHPTLCLMYERLEIFSHLEQPDAPCSCPSDPVLSTPSTAASNPLICPRHFTQANLPPLGYRTEWARGAACNICQSAEYVMQESMGELGPKILMPRIVIVREFLVFAPGDWTRELRWIACLVGRIQEMGNDISSYI